MAAVKKSQFANFLLIFAVVYLGYFLVFRVFFPTDAQIPQGGVTMEMEDASITIGATPIVIIENKTDKTIDLDEADCLPVKAFKADPVDPTKLTPLSGEAETDCEGPTELLPGAEEKINLGPWKYSMFAEPGMYELELRVATGTVLPTGSGADQSQYREGIITRFTISEPGIFTKLFRAFITKPFLNILIFVASLLPDHNLGISIIVLTILVKLLLFIPTQHALEGQKKMQMLQPKFEAIKKQYKDDPKKMQEETMKVWKDHKVNPFQACLPLLVQFPVLIGLFYVIRDGIDLDVTRHLIYPFYQHLDWSFNPMFLGLDLRESYVWLFPPLLVVMQFIQMKLSFMIADKKKAKEIKDTTTPEADTAQEIQQRVMLYVLPLMIGFFALKFPSAVSLYWGISTLFAIGQQIIVNREHINVRSSS